MEHIRIKSKLMDCIKKTSKAGKDYYLLNHYIKGVGSVEDFCNDEIVSKIGNQEISLDGAESELFYEVTTINNKLCLRLVDVE